MRKGTADLAKGIAILLMIQVHLIELFARPQVFNSLLGKISLFLGGPVVAPVFIAVMGYFLARSNRPVAQWIRRGAYLIVLGLLLNIGLNGHLLYKIYQGIFIVNPLEFILGVDILIMAGMGIILIALLRPMLKDHIGLYFFLACIIVFLAPYIQKPLTINSSLKYGLAFIGGNYHWSYFPLFPWLAYPLIGYGFALLEKKDWKAYLTPELQSIIVAILGIGLGCTLPYAINISANLPVYYHHGPLFFLWTIFFLPFWMIVLSMLERDFSQHTLLRYMKWLGRQVTSLYVLQWLIIGNTATAIYKSQGMAEIIVWYILILVITSLLAFLFEKIKKTWEAYVMADLPEMPTFQIIQ